MGHFTHPITPYGTVTYHMKSARHTRIEGLTTTQSTMFDRFEVQVPLAEGSQNMATVVVKLFLLPIHDWPELDRITHASLHIFDGHTVSYLRNNREVDIGTEPK